MPLAIRILLLVGLAISPALGIVAYNEYDLRRTRAVEAREFVAQTSVRAAAEVRQVVDNVQRFSAIVAKLPEVRMAAETNGFSDACSDLLTSLRQDYPGQLEFGITSWQGLIVCTTQGARTSRAVVGTHFKQAVEANTFVVGTYGESRTTGARYLTFAHPIRDQSGAATGAVLTGVDLKWLTERLRPYVGPSHAVLSLHDRDVTFLARVPNEGGLIGKKPPPDVLAASRFANQGPIEAKGADGTNRIGAIVTISLSSEAPDLHLAYGLSRDAVFAETNAATQRGIGLLLLSAVLAMAAAWYGGRRYIREPIRHLLAAARRWQEGDYAARVSLSHASPEFRRLATAYEAMADALARRDDHQRLLIHELNHRVKNTLATVQALASQAVKGEPGNSEGRAAFEGRLFALSKAHDILTRENWEGADLRSVLTEVVEPYSRSGPARITLEGSALRLDPRMTLSLAMAIHELATNAAKYGALSASTGRVVIRWEVRPGELPHLTLQWRESGGPAVSPPTHKGFGTRLIERSLATELAGDVRVTYEPSGVVCVIDAPLPEAAGGKHQAR